MNVPFFNFIKNGLLGGVFLLLSVSGVAAARDPKEVELYKSRLIPVPQKIEFNEGMDFALKEGSPISLNLFETEGAEAKAIRLARRYWELSPKFTVKKDEAASELGRDAYEVTITPEMVGITARGMDGLMNAFKTLRQLAEVQPGTMTVQGYCLVPCKITDRPAVEFRGIHLCIFPETPLWEIERNIRIAAYHKYNYAVVEPWGVFPFKSHPQFCWQDRKINRAEFKRIIQLGKELGITLVPQFNILGHAAAAREGTGKHAVLNASREFQPLFEPQGWVWCLTNPETRRVLTDLVIELDDFFDSPPYFHIGCDEAWGIATCKNCRKQPVEKLMFDHISYFNDLLKKRGARPIMWHDMLIAKSDPRWKGFIAFGDKNMAELYQKLPKDIVIADWQYSYNAKQDKGPDPAWPTMKFFKDANFSVLGCPWVNAQGVRSIGKFASKEKLLGVLETTWHINHGGRHQLEFAVGAQAAWNPTVRCVGVALRSHTRHLREIGWDMGISDYEKTGWNLMQVNPGHMLDDR